jgi:hypothetical protein
MTGEVLETLPARLGLKLAYVRSLGFDRSFREYLARYRFSGGQRRRGGR